MLGLSTGSSNCGVSGKTDYAEDGCCVQCLRFAYAYAKRGQVLLCEQWAELHPKDAGALFEKPQPHANGCFHPVSPMSTPNKAILIASLNQLELVAKGQRPNLQVKVVSCHPGWTSTPAVDEAYGSSITADIGHTQVGYSHSASTEIGRL